MIIATWSLGLLIATWLLHLLCWRIRLPENHTITLLVLFFTSPFVFIAICKAAGCQLPDGLIEWLMVATVYVPCALSYIIAYSAIEHESPTCRMMRLIADSGKNGLSAETIVNTLNPDSFMEERLVSLCETGGLRLENEHYQLLAKGRRMAAFFTLIARIFGIRVKGG